LLVLVTVVVGHPAKVFFRWGLGELGPEPPEPPVSADEWRGEPPPFLGIKMNIFRKKLCFKGNFN
jgi:hypothetical protein